MPGAHDGVPVIEYLLKEISFSTCDNKFFGELEKEMLIPNNLNIYGRISGAQSLHNHKLRAQFPEDTALAYLKQPLSNTVEDGKRVLLYALDDLINYEDYWWLPIPGETEFILPLNLLPPFPSLNPVDLAISCRPDVAIGVETDVTTTVRLGAEEQIDHLFLTFSSPPFASPGVSMAISEFSGDNVKELRQVVTAPKKEFPFPRLSMSPGDSKEYTIRTRIRGDTRGMTALKCQQDILRAKLVVLSDSSPADLPCAVEVLDKDDKPIHVAKTEKSTILQVQAQIMYSPFSIRREPNLPAHKKIEIPAV